MKKIWIFLFVLLIINSSFVISKNSENEQNSFEPEDIELKDDAFHKSLKPYFSEWWYFDADLEQGKSIQISFIVLSILNRGLILTRCNFYEDGELLINERKINFLSSFYASEEIPLIKINNKEVMKGHIDVSTKDWVYDLNLSFEKISLNLRFVGESKGWKGKTSVSDWGVILPYAKVLGAIKIDDSNIDVIGSGYHDHNWDMHLKAGLNFGWYWGNINSNSYTITWADILTTRVTQEPLIVLNQKDGSYKNINEKNIRFSTESFSLRNGHVIPNSFSIYAQQENIDIHIDMKVEDVHYIKFLGMDYWRYHLQCTGYVKVGSNIEQINDIHIAEFLKFR